MSSELGPIYDRLTRMETVLDNIAEDVTEVRAQATATNGKVAALKEDQIRREAFRDLAKTTGRWAAGIAAVLVAAILLAGLGL